MLPFCMNECLLIFQFSSIEGTVRLISSNSQNRLARGPASCCIFLILRLGQAVGDR